MNSSMHAQQASAFRFNRAHLVRPRAPHHPAGLAAAIVLSSVWETGDVCERLDHDFTGAVALYEHRDWHFAFDRLVKLADGGNAPAAKLALLMLRYGTTLYGTTFRASPTQIARWAQRVLRASSRATASPSSITAKA